MAKKKNASDKKQCKNGTKRVAGKGSSNLIYIIIYYIILKFVSDLDGLSDARH